MSARGLRATLVTAIVAMLTGASTAPAAPSDEPLGTHVAECAQMSLGKRADPPTVTCTHMGHVHTFANFGELVAHLREHDG